jgi:ornithine--oxo-acid transaminase
MKGYSSMAKDTKEYLAEVDKYSAQNYHPLPAILSKGEGCWVWDIEGNKYLDMLAAYSALNQGHRHPVVMRALAEQASKLTLTSRAFHNDQMGPFIQELCEMTGYEQALLMNSGAEAVETALKAARRWGYNVKGVPAEQAEVICCTNNFHGRTITVVSFSSEEGYRDSVR